MDLDSFRGLELLQLIQKELLSVIPQILDRALGAKQLPYPLGFFLLAGICLVIQVMSCFCEGGKEDAERSRMR